MSTPAAEGRRVSILDLQNKKAEGRAITMTTAYDYLTAKMVDGAGIDMILVGDSLAILALGHENTVTVSMEEMLHHCRAVARGAKRCLLVGDMPFMSYQVTVPQAVENAGRFLKDGHMDAVSLEGGKERAEVVRAIVGAGIPVMGHIGLTPQTIALLGSPRAQGKLVEGALNVIDDAVALARAGCFAMIVEGVPDRLGALISERLAIPTLGISAGPHCSGQVQVLHHMVGMYDRATPKFARKYASFFEAGTRALQEYLAEVEAAAFPAPEHSYTLEDDVYSLLVEALEKRS